jgi:hypothetical protein
MHRRDYFGRCMAWRSAWIEILLEALKAIFEIRHVTASLVNRPSTFDVVLLREPLCKSSAEQMCRLHAITVRVLSSVRRTSCQFVTA